MPEITRIGTCGACGKSFRVPASGTRFRCKDCGGVVSVSADAPESPAAGTMPAPERVRPRTARVGSARLGTEGVQAAAQFRKAGRAVGFVWAIWLLNTIAVGVFLLRTYQGLYLAGFSHIGVGVWFHLAAGTATLAALVLGTLWMRHEPVLWIGVGMAFQILVGLLEYLEGEPPITALVWIPISSCLMPFALRYRRLRREHPELHPVQSLQSTGRESRARRQAHGGLTERDLIELTKLGNRRLWTKSAVAVGAVILVSGALALWLLRTLVPETSAVFAGFVRDWNGGDRGALDRRFEDGEEAARRNWSRMRAEPSLPTLGSVVTEVLHGGRGEMRWETSAGEVALAVLLEGRRWQVSAFQPPVPPLAELPEAFRSAWNAGRLEDLVALYASGDPERVRRLFERLKDSRGWSDAEGAFAPPRLAGPEEALVRGQRATCTYASEAGAFEVTFRVGEDGTWGVASVELPGQTASER